MHGAFLDVSPRLVCLFVAKGTAVVIGVSVVVLLASLVAGGYAGKTVPATQTPNKTNPITLNSLSPCREPSSLIPKRYAAKTPQRRCLRVRYPPCCAR